MNSDNLLVYKSLFRFKIRQALQGLSKEEQKKRSRHIAALLFKESSFKRAKSVMIYLAFGNEVLTHAILLRALSLAKRVCVPKVEKNLRNLRAYQIKNLKRDLTKGAYGILEPKTKSLKEIHPGELDLILVPGLGFDLSGGRLGRGEGYFDRFLKASPKAVKIGLAYSEQILKEVPTASHDIRMNKIICG